MTSTELVRGNFRPIYIDFESKIKRKIKSLLFHRENCRVYNEISVTNQNSYIKQKLNTKTINVLPFTLFQLIQ
jgi:hypothetical protein